MQTVNKSEPLKLSEKPNTLDNPPILPARPTPNLSSDISNHLKDKMAQATTAETQFADAKIPRNTFLKSFVFAFQGILYVLRTQRNMRVHLVAGILVLLVATLFQVSVSEWASLLTVMALVYALEMLNTVAEAIVDMVTQEYHPLAKVAKDVAAGAVLVAAIFAVGVAVVIFLPRVLHLAFTWLGW